MSIERRDLFSFEEKFVGDWELFREAINNPEVYYIYDADGVLVYSAERVFESFEKRYGIKVSPKDINAWNYLTNVAAEKGLSDESVTDAEKDWYNSSVLESSRRYLHAKPLVNLTVKLAGKEKNLVLTSREPYLAEGTYRWFDRNFPMLLRNNILIRNSDSEISGTRFKVNSVRERAGQADWVVFMDDSTKYIKAVLDAGIPNCLAILIPQGVVKPEFSHDHLITVGRFPEEMQGMYPLYSAFKKALY